MGILRIEVDAEDEGDDLHERVRFKGTFTWEGGTQEIESTMRKFERVPLPPEELARACLLGVLEEHGEDSPSALELRTMAMAWLVLQAPTGRPDRPGAVYRYAASEEVRAKITVTLHKCQVEILGMRRLG